jgi:hypothetical protein
MHQQGIIGLRYLRHQSRTCIFIENDMGPENVNFSRGIIIREQPLTNQFMDSPKTQSCKHKNYGPCSFAK